MSSVIVTLNAGGTVSYVRGPVGDLPNPGDAELSLSTNPGDAALFPDLATAQAWVAAHNALPGGAAPTYTTVAGDENESAGTVS